MFWHTPQSRVFGTPQRALHAPPAPPQRPGRAPTTPLPCLDAANTLLRTASVPLYSWKVAIFAIWGFGESRDVRCFRSPLLDDRWCRAPIFKDLVAQGCHMSTMYTYKCKYVHECTILYMNMNMKNGHRHGRRHGHGRGHAQRIHVHTSVPGALYNMYDQPPSGPARHAAATAASGSAQERAGGGSSRVAWPHACGLAASAHRKKTHVTPNFC